MGRPDRRPKPGSDEYGKLLADADCEARPVAEWADYSCWLHTVTVANRHDVLAYMRERGVDTRAIWPPLSTQPLFGTSKDPFPVAESVASRAMWLPTFSGMASSDIEFVAQTLRQAIVRAEEQ